MALYLGIDGGGTGCRAAVADDAGVVIGRGLAGPANIASDLDLARQNILEATWQAMTEAVGTGSCEAELRRLRAGLGLAGANAAGAVERLKLNLPFAHATVETDAVTTAIGALGGQDGVVAAIGTGSVFGSVRQGKFRQIGGWGLVLGDEGSAALLGRSILSAALRAQDGHIAMTPLLAKLLKDHGGPSGVVSFAQSARPSDFAALAPQVTGSQDPVAQALLQQATMDVADCIALLRGEADMPVVFTGGLGPFYQARFILTKGWTIKRPSWHVTGWRVDAGTKGGVMEQLFNPLGFDDPGAGPLYLQLQRRIADSIASGRLLPGNSLPAERDMAAMTGLSRVTVRKAIQALVASGQLVQRRGSGTFVAPKVERLEQALSMLTSFTEDMARRGKSVESAWLARQITSPSPEEVMALGLGAGERVARLERVRRSDGIPLAIERASLSPQDLPNPTSVETSLYAVLEARGLRPVRAVQRISAANLAPKDAELLGVPTGAAGLRIERIGYLPSGRVVEFTRSIYRGDAYDFAVELTLAPSTEGPEV